jgi:hypothetical protein
MQGEEPYLHALSRRLWIPTFALNCVLSMRRDGPYAQVPCNYPSSSQTSAGLPGSTQLRSLSLRPSHDTTRTRPRP